MPRTSKFLKRAVPLVLVASTLFGCSGGDISFDWDKATPTAAGFNTENVNNGLVLMSQTQFDKCTDWSVKDFNNHPDVYSCTGDGSSVHMAWGVYSDNYQTLTNSDFYKSKGQDKSDVFVDTSSDSVDDILVTYLDGQYLVELAPDSTKGFDMNLDESEAEGVMATVDAVDSGEWVEGDDENPEVLVNNNTGQAMFMGAMFASMMAMQNSNFYKSNGFSKQGIAVPNAYKNSNKPLSFAKGNYTTNTNSIKSNNVSVNQSSSFKAGGGKGMGGMGSGARGGGAS